MSIKIYNGYKIKKTIIDDQQSFQNLISNMQEEAIKKLFSEFKTKIEYRIIAFFSHYFLNNEFKSTINLHSLFDFNSPNLYNVTIFDILKNSIVVPEEEFYYYFSFYPVGDLFLCIINNNLKCKPPKQFKPYYYFDSTDKPESISTQEWKVREKKWKLAFKQPNNFLNLLEEDLIYFVHNSAIDTINYLNFHNEKQLKQKAADILFKQLSEKDNSLKIFDFVDKLTDDIYKKEILSIVDSLRKNSPTQYLGRDYLEKFKFDVIDNNIIFKGLS